MLNSGPPKGYVEALEHRLQVTESALLRLLAQVSDAQLSEAIPDERSAKNGGVSYMPMARLEKKGVDDWPHFPLDTARNIREWQHACTGQGLGSSVSHYSIQTDQSSSDVCGQHRGQKRKLGSSGRGPGEETARDYSELMIPRHDDEQSPESPLETGFAQRNPPSTRREYLDLSRIQPNELMSPSELHPVQTQSSWGGAPSLNFQKQFLW